MDCWRNDIDGENQSTRRKICYSSTLPTTKMTWSGQGSNLPFRIERRRLIDWATEMALRPSQTGAKYSQRQRSLRCEFCRGLERTRRQVAVPTLARKNRSDVCEIAAIYSRSLLARFLSLSPCIVQLSHTIPRVRASWR
jgi:hypothetical protein